MIDILLNQIESEIKAIEEQPEEIREDRWIQGRETGLKIAWRLARDLQIKGGNDD